MERNTGSPLSLAYRHGLRQETRHNRKELSNGGALPPFRDFARNGWPFGQRNIAIRHHQATAVTRATRLVLASPCGLAGRRGVCDSHHADRLARFILVPAPDIPTL